MPHEQEVMQISNIVKLRIFVVFGQSRILSSERIFKINELLLEILYNVRLVYISELHFHMYEKR